MALETAVNSLAELGAANVADVSWKNAIREVEFTGADPIYNTPFYVGTAGATALAAYATAICQIWKMRSGVSQKVRIDLRDAAISLRSQAMLTQNGYPLNNYGFEPPILADFFKCKDNRWIFLHGVYPSLRIGLLNLLECKSETESVQAVVSKWNSKELEDAIGERGLTAGIARTPEEWLAHPQGKAVASLPVVEVIKIGESPPEPFLPADRPLSGVRVLDMAHVIGGPMLTRMLAEQGADVMRVWHPNGYWIARHIMDTGHGKLSATLDLKSPGGLEKIHAMIKGADVFCQSYRPGSLASKGMSPEDLIKIRPGLIYSSVSCYGSVGPFSKRPGWEQVAQSVSGMAVVQKGSQEKPVLNPVIITDYLTGYLGAFGTLLALMRRSIEGGSYLVRPSLCQSAHWVQSLGLVPGSQSLPPEVTPDTYRHLMTEAKTRFGNLRYLRPVINYSATPARFERLTSPIGSDELSWDIA